MGVKNRTFNEVIAFALSKKCLHQKVSYLIKGFIFAPWLMKKTAKLGATHSQSAIATSQDAGDIYPLF